MNLHKNARTMPRSRLLMAGRVLEQKQPAAKASAAPSCVAALGWGGGRGDER
jgi:hypothetical protein